VLLNCRSIRGGQGWEKNTKVRQRMFQGGKRARSIVNLKRGDHQGEGKEGPSHTTLRKKGDGEAVTISGKNRLAQREKSWVHRSDLGPAQKRKINKADK